MVRSLLITGAKGYLGGRLVAALADDPACSVTGTTRGAAEAPLGWPRSCRLIRLDAQNDSESTLAEAMRGIDTIVHLAAPNEIASAEAPADALLGTGLASLKLLRAAQSAGCRRFIYLSTLRVYGDSLQGSVTEADLPRPTHPYAIAHRTAEDFVLAAHAKHEIEGIAVRLSNAIGAPAWPGVDRWTLIGNEKCRQAVTEGRITLRTNGLQWRDFIPMRDFVAAIRHAINMKTASLGDGLFNVGGRRPLRIIDVAEMIAQRAGLMLGRDIPVERPHSSADAAELPIEFCIDRFSATGYAPSQPGALEEEIDATLALCLAAAKR